LVFLKFEITGRRPNIMSLHRIMEKIINATVFWRHTHHSSSSCLGLDVTGTPIRGNSKKTREYYNIKIRTE
jgi:hypothetical protein